MSDIRYFKCQQCHHEQALDTVFNFEVCPRCGGNLFPLDYEPPVDWKLRAEKAERDLNQCAVERDMAKRDRDRAESRTEELRKLISSLPMLLRTWAQADTTEQAFQVEDYISRVLTDYDIAL